MPKACLQDWIVLSDYKIFHLCNMFLKQKDYTLLEEIVTELRAFTGTKESPALLTTSLLHYIYNEYLTDEMKLIYIDIEIALINFYGSRESIFKQMKVDYDSDKNIDDFHR
jgi:hypothetical protein